MSTRYSFNIEEALRFGLRKSRRTARNAQHLIRLVNVEPSESGLRDFEPITDPFSGGLPESISYPFPQLFFGKSVTLLCYETSIYEVDTSTTPWTAELLQIVDKDDEGVEFTIPSGSDTWHFIDLFDNWFLVSSRATLFQVKKSSLFVGGSDPVRGQSAMTMFTGCEHRGRIVLGGFVPSTFWNSTWQDLWTYWVSRLPSQANFNLSATTDAPGRNFVMWSSIGGGDVPLCFFYPDLVATPGAISGDEGYWGSSEPWIFQSIRRNEMGWMPIPLQGDVMVVKPLGKNIVVYCENGIAVMPHAATPFPTYGVEVISRVGIVGKNAVAGDSNEHTFIDHNGKLWRLSEGSGLQLLGYDYFFEDYVTEDIICSYDPGNKRYFITLGDSDTNYVYQLNEFGLSQIRSYDSVISVYYTNYATVGVFKDSGSNIDDHVVIETDVLDFGNRDYKVIDFIELGIDHVDSETLGKVIKIWSRENSADEFTTSEAHTINDDGTCDDIMIGGIEFKIEIDLIDGSVAANSDFKLDWIKVHYEQRGRRYIRGI